MLGEYNLRDLCYIRSLPWDVWVGFKTEIFYYMDDLGVSWKMVREAEGNRFFWVHVEKLREL